MLLVEWLYLIFCKGETFANLSTILTNDFEALKLVIRAVLYLKNNFYLRTYYQFKIQAGHCTAHHKLSFRTTIFWTNF